MRRNKNNNHNQNKNEKAKEERIERCAGEDVAEKTKTIEEQKRRKKNHNI